MDADAGAASGIRGDSGKFKKNQFKCIVPGCRSSTSTNLAKLHSFPWRDMPRARKWIVAVGCLELLGAPPKALLRLRVCDLHFDKKLKRGKNMKLFDNSAVPTLKLTGVQKTAATISKRLPRKVQKVQAKKVKVKKEKVTKEKVTKEKVKKEKVEETSETSEATAESADLSLNGGNSATQTPIRVPRELARFLTLRETLQKKNSARKGYDKKFAVFALNLYLSCPTAYRVLWKSLRLPSPTLLPRVDLGIGTRFSSDLVACFRSKMEKVDPGERECVLCIDEVELSEKLFYAIDKDEIVGLEEVGGVLRAAPASRALLLVARGARGSWTQPLGYFYLAADTELRDAAPPLRRLALQVLHDAGCRVRAVVSALGPTFAELAAALGVTVESPCLADATRRRRIAFLHDPEQLVLTLRDTLLAYDIKFRDVDGGGELRASWRDVEALRAADCARALRQLPELTRARVAPGPRAALRPAHAAAVFSRRVAAHVAAVATPDCKSRVGTARLLRLVSELRAALAAPAKRNLARAADAACSSLCDMRIVSAEGEEHDAEVFVRALQVSLAGALLALAEAPLPLARGALRPLRRFAERVEGARGRVAPRCFRAAFRRWAMRHLVAPAPGPRADDDLAGLLRKAEEGSTAEEWSGAERCVAVGPLEHRVDVARKGSLERVAALLLRECRRAHGCAAFVAWAADAGRFREMVRSMDAAFRRMFAEKVLNAVGRQALGALRGCLEGRLPCACFPRDTCCRLFVRFRIRAALLAYNRALRGGTLSDPDADRWLFT